MTHTYSTLEQEIPEFPNYNITAEGRVINVRTGREMTLSPTQHGELTVGLMKDVYDEEGNVRKIQFRRSVKVLVARAFVDGESDLFDTPILLDHDEHNLHVENIQWRPRWFAWKYYRQFEIEPPLWYEAGPILDENNNTQYSTIYDCAMINGLLCEDIHRSILLGEEVFPSGETYTYTNMRNIH